MWWVGWVFFSIAFCQAFATGLWEAAREVSRASSWGSEKNETGAGRGEGGKGPSPTFNRSSHPALCPAALVYICLYTMMGRERISRLDPSRGKHRVPVKRWAYWAKPVLGCNLSICLKGSPPMFYCCYMPKDREVIDPCSSFPCGMLWVFRLFTITCPALCWGSSSQLAYPLLHASEPLLDLTARHCLAIIYCHGLYHSD